MLHTISIWLAVAAFAGAGLVNVTGRTAQRDSFVRWGYPTWWGRLTGVLELAVAVMIAVPFSRTVGLLLGATILAAAAATVVRYREFSHLVPNRCFRDSARTCGSHVMPLSAIPVPSATTGILPLYQGRHPRAERNPSQRAIQCMAD